MPIEDLLDRYTAEGYTSKEAAHKVAQLQKYAQQLVAGCKDSEHLLSRLAGQDPNELVAALPRIMDLVNFPLNVYDFAMDCLVGKSFGEISKQFMRNYESIFSGLGSHQRRALLGALRWVDDFDAAYSFSLYADKLQGQPEANEIYSYIMERKEVLPMLACLSPDKLPSDMLGIRATTLAVEDPLCLPGIKAVKRVNHYCGTCPDMFADHMDTFLDERSSDYGNTVMIESENQIIGAIKLKGEQSLLGLRNIVDSQGRLVLALGGVYAPAKDLVVAARIAGPASSIACDQLQVQPLCFYGQHGGWEFIEQLQYTLCAVRQAYFE